MTSDSKHNYGQADSSYKAAGSIEGIHKLCVDFFEIMKTDLEGQKIYQMHTDPHNLMVEKLSLFLTMWLGGPKTYKQKYKFYGIPNAHKHLVINHQEKQIWLNCMDLAIDKQSYRSDFKFYLKHQLRFPAEMIRKVCAQEQEFKKKES